MNNFFELPNSKINNKKVEKEISDPETLSWDEKLYYIFYEGGKYRSLTRVEWPDGEEETLRKGVENGSIVLRGWAPGRFCLNPHLRKQWDKKN